MALERWNLCLAAPPLFLSSNPREGRGRGERKAHFSAKFACTRDNNPALATPNDAVKFHAWCVRAFGKATDKLDEVTPSGPESGGERERERGGGGREGGGTSLATHDVLPAVGVPNCGR